MSAFLAWFRRCGTLLLVCCAVLLFSVGCRSASTPSNAGGVASKNSSGGFFGPEQKKPQTPSDFLFNKQP